MKGHVSPRKRRLAEKKQRKQEKREQRRKSKRHPSGTDPEVIVRRAAVNVAVGGKQREAHRLCHVCEERQQFRNETPADSGRDRSASWTGGSKRGGMDSSNGEKHWKNP